MSQLSIFLARSIGLFTVLLVAGFMARGGTVIEATVEDEAVMISYAIIAWQWGSRWSSVTMSGLAECCRWSLRW